MLMLLFYCGSDCFALDCESIVEIFPKVKLQKIPGQNEKTCLAGLFNYGGKPIPVIDLCLYVDKRPCSNSMHTRLILVEVKQHLLAIMAEKVTETAELNREQFLESGLQLEGLPFLRGVYSKGDKAVQFFDLSIFCQSLNGLLA